MNLQEVKCRGMNRFDLAQGDRRRAFVNAVVNIQVP